MGQGNDLNDLFVFSEKRRQWTAVEPKTATRPAARSYHAGGAIGQILFVFGGCSGHNRLNDLWRFDTVQAVWEQLHSGEKNCPSVRGGAMLFVPSENEVFVFCGFAGAELGDAWKFDVASRTWHLLAPIPMSARSVAACANLNGRALIFGGERDPSTDGHKGAGHMVDDVFVFDPKDESWTTVFASGPLKPSARGWMDWAPIDSSTLLLVGGLSEDNERFADAFLFQLSEK